MRSFASLAMLGAMAPGVSADCSCKYQGSVLPAELYQTYPLEEPGKYNTTVAYGWYGTMCAAWDQVPGTPWFSDYCTDDKNFTGADSWCQAPWCYVDETCESKVASSVFNGSSTAFYSYATCGAPDCYNNQSNAGCPFGKVFEDTCPCLYQGQELSSSLIADYPLEAPGKYANHTGIELYGTTCAAWDQQPETPWYSYCPEDSDWCDGKSWCQAPWCYVDENCSSKVASSVFNGSSTAFYSYATCGAPDCYSSSDNASCPYDGTSHGWFTAVDCDATTTQEADDATSMEADDATTMEADDATTMEADDATDATTMEADDATDATTMEADDATTMKADDATTMEGDGATTNTTKEEQETEGNEGSKAASALALSSITVSVIMAIAA